MYHIAKAANINRSLSLLNKGSALIKDVRYPNNWYNPSSRVFKHSTVTNGLIEVDLSDKNCKSYSNDKAEYFCKEYAMLYAKSDICCSPLKSRGM